MKTTAEDVELVIVKGRFVESMTIDGVELPIRHIRSYTINEDAEDVTRVTVEFFCRPVFVYKENNA